MSLSFPRPASLVLLALALFVGGSSNNMLVDACIPAVIWKRKCRRLKKLGLPRPKCCNKWDVMPPVLPPTNSTNPSPMAPKPSAPIAPPMAAPVKAPINGTNPAPMTAPVAAPTNSTNPAPFAPAPTGGTNPTPVAAPIANSTDPAAPMAAPRAPVQQAPSVPVFSCPPDDSPTKPPMKPVTKPPSKPPVFSCPPDDTPTKPPMKPVTKPPTKPIETRPPTKPPVKPDTKPPTKQPTKPPTKPPTKAPTKAPTKTPTKAPTKRPTRPPTKPPIPSPPSSTWCACAKIYGDPHIRTFDGVKYDYQGVGDHVLYKATPPGAAVHGQFLQFGSVSLTTGVAAVDGGARVEVYAYQNGNPPTLWVTNPHPGTPTAINYAAGGTVHTDTKVKVTYNVIQKTFVIDFLPSRLMVTVRYRPNWARKHFDVVIRHPCIWNNSTVTGLLGTPDGNGNNEWMSSTTGLSIPYTQPIAPATGYSYGIANWCIANVANSLFHVPAPATGCTGPFRQRRLNVAAEEQQPSDEVKAVCGKNAACLLDGSLLGVDAAKNVLIAESTDEVVFRNVTLFASPKAVLANARVNVTITLDLNTTRGPWTPRVPSVSSYSIALVDSVAKTISAPIGKVYDVGSGVGADTIARDYIYANVISMVAPSAGTSLGLVAIADKDGEEFAFSVLDEINTYSIESGIVG